MQREPGGRTVRNSLVVFGSYLLAVVGWGFHGCLWVAGQGSSLIRGISRRARSLWSALTDYLTTLLESETTRRVLERVADGLLGVRREISAVAILSAPLLALSTGWWVVTTSNYHRIESMAVGTWTGTNPEPLVFFGVGAIIAVATLFTAFNSGFIPTTVLTMAPTSGIGFARYGLTTGYYGTVGIPDAITIGLITAVAIGLPLGVAGFVLGTLLRQL